MRALEVPLARASEELMIVKSSATWEEAFLSAFEQAIKAKFPDTKDATHRQQRAFYAALEGHLRAIKIAWRNPTMHSVARTYTEEMTDELILLVKGFMREAATGLSEPIATSAL